MKRLFHIFAVLFCIGLWVGSSLGQIYAPFYGKNRVLYTRFKWEHYETDHYDIYYYNKDIKTLQRVANLAESAYADMSKMIRHQLSAKIPLLYYVTSTDFQQSNLFMPPEGALGVSEPLLFRVAIQGDMSEDELYDLMLHELSHIFQFDLLWGSPGGVIYAVSQPPLWVFEGFSEYSTNKWSSWSELIVRDAVLSDRIPEFAGGGHMYSQYPNIRPPAYDFGHAVYDYIETEYGKNGVGNFWQTMKGQPMIGRTDPLQRAFEMNPKQFSFEFKKYLREKYKDFLLRENPDNYGISLGPEYPLNNYWFAFTHAVSPSGDLVATITYNVSDFDLDIILFSAERGQIFKNLTKGYSLKYESIKFEIEPSNGKALSWSHDGDKIAFTARSGEKHAIFIIDSMTGKILQKIKIAQDQPYTPCFMAGDAEILFTAFENGIHDIFKVNLETLDVVNLTEDKLYEKAVSASPDGQLVAYTIRLDDYDKIFVSPTDNLKKKTQLTFGDGNTITPPFSPDSQEIYFTGDMREAYNIYSVSLDSGEIKRYTDVRTGNFLPTPDPNEPGKIIFAAFNKGAFQVFKTEFEPELIKVATPDDLEPGESYERFEPHITVEVDPSKISEYSGLGSLYIVGRPPVQGIISTDGSLYGGAALGFADLFHDHIFSVSAYQVRSLRSYSFSYLNQTRRLHWMANVFSYSLYYYPNYAYYAPELISVLSYRDAIATRGITGAQLTGYYPFNMYYRLETSVGYTFYEEDFYDPYMNQILNNIGNTYNYFWNGSTFQVSAALVGETTRFKMYGPAKGMTYRASINQAVPFSNSWISSTTLSLDFRNYLYVGADALLAFRFNGFMGRGKNPYVNYWGGNNTVRSSYYYNIIGTEGWFGTLEFRFPLINAASTLLGLIGPVRGKAFFDVTRSKLGDAPALQPVYELDQGMIRSGFAEAIGSYGFGFELFFMGLPLHFEWVWGLQWKDFSRPFDFDRRLIFDLHPGGKLMFWIGFDF